VSRLSNIEHVTSPVEAAMRRRFEASVSIHIQVFGAIRHGADSDDNRGLGLAAFCRRQKQESASAAAFCLHFDARQDKSAR